MKKQPFAWAYCPEDSHIWKVSFDKPESYWKVEPLFTHDESEPMEEDEIFNLLNRYGEIRGDNYVFDIGRIYRMVREIEDRYGIR